MPIRRLDSVGGMLGMLCMLDVVHTALRIEGAW